MEEFIKSDLEFEDNELYWLVERLRENFNNSQLNFVKTCECIYNIWKYCKGNYYKAKDNEYYNSYKLLAKFGFDKKAVNRYKNCYERYVHPQSCSLYPIYEDFTCSKLFELLVLSEDTAKNSIINGLVLPTMTVKQIREHIKTLKDGSDKAEKVIEKTTEDETSEETIPMAYDPTKHYDFDYFKDLSKQQLINNIWELQKEYERLKSQLPKPTKSKALKSMLVG